jgi:hypothetical protein
VPIIPQKHLLTIFRVRYYLAILILFLLYHTFIKNMWVYLFLIIYLLAFRCFVWLMVKKGFKAKNYLEA